MTKHCTGLPVKIIPVCCCKVNLFPLWYAQLLVCSLGCDLQGKWRNVGSERPLGLNLFHVNHMSHSSLQCQIFPIIFPDSHNQHHSISSDVTATHHLNSSAMSRSTDNAPDQTLTWPGHLQLFQHAPTHALPFCALATSRDMPLPRLPAEKQEWLPSLFWY